MQTNINLHEFFRKARAEADVQPPTALLSGSDIEAILRSKSQKKTVSAWYHRVFTWKKGAFVLAPVWSWRVSVAFAAGCAFILVSGGALFFFYQTSAIKHSTNGSESSAHIVPATLAQTPPKSIGSDQTFHQALLPKTTRKARVAIHSSIGRNALQSSSIMAFVSDGMNASAVLPNNLFGIRPEDSMTDEERLIDELCRVRSPINTYYFEQ